MGWGQPVLDMVPRVSFRYYIMFTVLGLVCERMAERVMLARQEAEDRRARQDAANLASIVEHDAGEVEDKEDDEGAADEREIWEVTDVTEEDCETTEGEVVD